MFLTSMVSLAVLDNKIGAVGVLWKNMRDHRNAQKAGLGGTYVIHFASLFPPVVLPSSLAIMFPPCSIVLSKNVYENLPNFTTTRLDRTCHNI